MRQAALRFWYGFQPGLKVLGCFFAGACFRQVWFVSVFLIIFLYGFHGLERLFLPQISAVQAGELDEAWLLYMLSSELDGAEEEKEDEDDEEEKEEKEQAEPEFSLYADVAGFLLQNWISRPQLGRAKARSARDVQLLESFAGVDFTSNQFSYYTGVISRVPGQFPGFEGVRLRVVQGMGWYRYERQRQVGLEQVKTRFMGHSRFLEGMVGYEWQALDSIFKLYGGIISIEHDIDPRDETNQLQGREAGAKILLEAWHEFENGAFFSAFGSYSTANEFYDAQLRLGLPLYEGVTGGIELGAFGDKQYDALRLGGFSEWQFGDGTLTFAGGVSGDYNEPDAFYISGKYALKLYVSDFFVK